MTDGVRRTQVRTFDAGLSPASTTTRPAKRPVKTPSVATADAASGSSAITQDRPNFTITPRSPQGSEPAVGSRAIPLPGTSTASGEELPANRFRRGIALEGDRGAYVTTASSSDVVDGLADSRKFVINDADDGGGVTTQEGLAEAADAIESGSKSTADALKASMPHLDDAGADELAKLMKTAAAAKGVSVASLVLSVNDVAMNWKNHGIDDPRTQDSLASLVGGSAGTAIGAALAGPLGAALGGMIGSYLGPKVADFARDLAEEYGDDVKEAVETMADGVKAVGSSIADAADAFGDLLGDLWNGVFGDGGIVDDITPDIDIPFF